MSPSDTRLWFWLHVTLGICLLVNAGGHERHVWIGLFDLLIAAINFHLAIRLSIRFHRQRRANEARKRVRTTQERTP